MYPGIRRRALPIVLVMAASIAVPLTLTSGVATAGPGVAERAVSFTVVNRETHPVTPGCPEDNATYTVRGHLTGPADRLDDETIDAGSLYVHGHSFSEELWRYRAVEGYDWVAEMAELGHVSVSYDRLGYESSDKPHGDASCYTTEADVCPRSSST